MTRSIWTVLALGAVGAACLMMAMCFSLQTFVAMPAGGRAKLAEKIRGRFGFEGAGVRLEEEGGRRHLRIWYETRRDSGYDVILQQREMKEVAELAAREYEGREIMEIEEIRVTRSEVKGSGCWEDRQVARESFPNPRRKPRPGEDEAVEEER